MLWALAHTDGSAEQAALITDLAGQLTDWAERDEPTLRTLAAHVWATIPSRVG
jgi:hypothetical protein